MSRGSRTLRVCAASAAVAALALSGVAAGTDAILLAWNGAGVQNTVATAATDAALAWFGALLIGPAWALILLGLGWLRRRPATLARAWPIYIAAAGTAIAMIITDALYRPHTAPYVIASAGFGGALAVIALITLVPSRPTRLLFLLGIGTLALLTDLLLPQLLDRCLRDLAGLVAAAALLAALKPLATRLNEARGRTVALALMLSFSTSLFVVYFVDDAVPGWRALAWQHGRWQPRLSRALRSLADFDGDGFSPLAWGGDCDDSDATRNPAAHDHDGIDANCNGTIKPAHPTDAQRGLAPPAGDPDEPAGAVDLVLLITVDSLRADALTPDVAPRLTQLARSGQELTQVYSAGSSTLHSLHLLLRGSDDAPPVGELLLKHNIATTVLFSYYDQRLEEGLFPGFAEARAPNQKEVRWSARELTNRGMATITGAGHRRQFLWLHYFDAHYPTMAPPDLPPVPTPAGRSVEFGQYLTAVKGIDRELGRLFDWLATTGRAPRTLILFTGDHGESFGEHGVGYHGVGAYQGVVHVPGLLAGAGVIPGRYNHVATHRDLPATILGGFGLVAGDPEVERFGRSWLRLRAAPKEPLHRFVVVRSTRAGDADESSLSPSMPLAAIADDQWKLLSTSEIGLEELYAPADDPSERDDQLTHQRRVAARLRHELALFTDIDESP